MVTDLSQFPELVGRSVGAKSIDEALRMGNNSPACSPSSVLSFIESKGMVVDGDQPRRVLVATLPCGEH